MSLVRLVKLVRRRGRTGTSSGTIVAAALLVALGVLLLAAVGAGAAPAVPGDVTGLASSTHPSETTWYSNSDPSFSWDPMLGIVGYSYEFDQTAGTVPDPTSNSLKAIMFGPRADLTVSGPAPASVAIADLNGDGNLDLAIADKGRSSDIGHTVSIKLGDGNGGFTSAADCTVGGLPYTVAAGRIGSDTNVDLVVANQSDGSISVLLGNGDGTFAAKADYVVDDVNSDVRQVVTGDFNGDGRDDVAVAAPQMDSVYVFLANADGTLQTKVEIAAGGAPEAVATGDFDGDGNLDLAVTDLTDETVSILLGDGAGAFAAPVPYGVGTDPRSVAVGDFNGDGFADLAVANWSSSTVSVLLGNGDGTFDAATDYGDSGVWSVPSSVTAADFNDDGKLDLAVTDWNSQFVSVLPGAGDGTFDVANRLSFLTGDEPMQVAAGDLNGDGLPDLVIPANGPTSDSAGVLLNETAIPPAASYSGIADGVWYFHVRGIAVLDPSVPTFIGSATTTTRTVKIDTVPPVTTDDAPASFSGSSVTVTLTPTDATSGVAGTWYNVDGAITFSSGTSVVVSGPGQHTLQYYSRDLAGNTEATVGKTIDGPVATTSFHIVASAGPGGHISPSGTISVVNGANETFAMVPDAGYHVADVVVDGNSLGARTSYTFTKVAEAHTISVSFAADILPMLGVPQVPSSVKHAKTFKVWGTLRPQFAAGAKTVELKVYVYRHKKWVAYKTYWAKNADSGAYTRYSLSLKLNGKGKYRFRAGMDKSAPYAAVSTAMSKTLKVK